MPPVKGSVLISALLIWTLSSVGFVVVSLARPTVPPGDARVHWVPLEHVSSSNGSVPCHVLFLTKYTPKY